MRCEPPMPAQFISTRATPCAASALAIAALTCSSSVTSAWRATPPISVATFSAFSLLWSSTATLAPLAAIARAVAAPRPEPPPVMRTATSFNCIDRLSLGVSSLDFFLVVIFLVLIVAHEVRLLSGRYDTLSRSRVQHPLTDQRFHVLDVLVANFIGDRTDAACARHRMAGG